MRRGKGFILKARCVLGSRDSCTHLTHMMMMAQSVLGWRVIAQAARIACIAMHDPLLSCPGCVLPNHVKHCCSCAHILLLPHTGCVRAALPQRRVVLLLNPLRTFLFLCTHSAPPTHRLCLLGAAAAVSCTTSPCSRVEMWRLAKSSRKWSTCPCVYVCIYRYVYRI